MKIKVIGKAHLSGTSKRTGKDYDFIQVHYNGKARGVEGSFTLPSAFNSISSPLTYSVQYWSLPFTCGHGTKLHKVRIWPCLLYTSRGV